MKSPTFLFQNVSPITIIQLLELKNCLNKIKLALTVNWKSSPTIIVSLRFYSPCGLKTKKRTSLMDVTSKVFLRFEVDVWRRNDFSIRPRREPFSWSGVDIWGWRSRELCSLAWPSGSERSGQGQPPPNTDIPSLSHEFSSRLISSQ